MRQSVLAIDSADDSRASDPIVCAASGWDAGSFRAEFADMKTQELLRPAFAD
ncbi:MAG: hypothetical protein U0836_09420 [Pirellulales bacterium]